MIRTVDSRSLWNHTQSPGWSDLEIETLKKCLLYFGIGKWTAIVNSDCFPNKTPAQINLQTQRLLGQQSLAEFMGLHIHTDDLLLVNSQRTGVERKAGIIINSGDAQTPEEKQRKIQENFEKYGVPEEEWSQIDIEKLAEAAQENYQGSFNQKLIHMDLQSQKDELQYLRRRRDYLNSLLKHRSGSPRLSRSSSSHSRRSRSRSQGRDEISDSYELPESFDPAFPYFRQKTKSQSRTRRSTQEYAQSLSQQSQTSGTDESE